VLCEKFPDHTEDEYHAVLEWLAEMTLLSLEDFEAVTKFVGVTEIIDDEEECEHD
jgi:hypothetical protein